MSQETSLPGGPVMIVLIKDTKCVSPFPTQEGRGFGLHAPASRPALWPTQLPIWWILWVRRPGREADHSPTSSAAEAKNALSCTGGSCIMRCLIICTLHQILGWWCQEGWGGKTCSTNGRDEKCIKNIDRKSEGKVAVGTPSRRSKDNIRMKLGEIWWESWTGLIWLRVGISGGLLWAL
jgi:hypothetical protein